MGTSKEEEILKGINKRDIEITRQMKNEGESYDKITRYTTVDKEQINKL